MSRKRDTQKKAKEFSINLASSPITFNKNATRWLDFQLDYRLDFLKYFNKKIAQVKQVLHQTRLLVKRKDLAIGLAKRVQVVAIISIILYRVEIQQRG